MKALYERIKKQEQSYICHRIMWLNFWELIELLLLK